MKNQALFSSKYKSKKLKCRLLQFLFGALRVNLQYNITINNFKLMSVHTRHIRFDNQNWFNIESVSWRCITVDSILIQRRVRVRISCHAMRAPEN